MSCASMICFHRYVGFDRMCITNRQYIDIRIYCRGEWYAGEFCVKVVKVGRVLIGFALQIRAADLALVAVFRRRGDGMRAAV